MGTYLCVVLGVTDGVALHHSGVGVVLQTTNSSQKGAA